VIPDFAALNPGYGANMEAWSATVEISLQVALFSSP